MFFFFNDTATTEIYTLSLHDALPICFFRPDEDSVPDRDRVAVLGYELWRNWFGSSLDRKSTRLNSSHLVISYAVFCLKKKTSRRFPPTRGASLSTLLGPRFRSQRRRA